MIQVCISFPQVFGRAQRIPTPRLKVRLQTTYYPTSRGVAQKRELFFYKKPNSEHVKECFIGDIRERERPLSGLIINFDDKPDGVYELRVCNTQRDIDGYVDDWDWQLVEWVEVQT